MTVTFDCAQVSAGYGAAPVIRDMSLQVSGGTIHAVLGPNGAGKTTLLMTIAGLLERRSGVVRVDGAELPSRRPVAASRAGIVLVPEDRALFSTLPVRENLEAARPKGAPDARCVLDWFPALEARWEVPAGALSGGEQQMLAIARGLIQRPRVLLIDEMSLGLAPVIAADLLRIMRVLADTTGAAIILVEQHVHLALDAADDATVLVHGAIALRGQAAELASQPDRLERAYLSGDPGADTSETS